MTIKEFIDEIVLPNDDRKIELSAETLFLLYQTKTTKFPIEDYFKNVLNMENQLYSSGVPTAMKDGFRTFFVDERVIHECLTV